ncbi:hypothetical protein BHE74_00037535 [Ensete ventricosum]|nr:hypothetical protein GW17_00049594 [Ensete ventricosum]RWW55786.1 hypothetical protein BHE74_00037535 [Ensete ventricosum]RZS05467.1 hypothetical protein BHM03_00035991 [Ensete ventricosum]
MLGIDRSIAENFLSIPPEAKLIKQKPHRFAPDQHKAISDEVNYLMEAGS